MNEDDILQFNILVLNETYYSDETTWGCFKEKHPDVFYSLNTDSGCFKRI